MPHRITLFFDIGGWLAILMAIVSAALAIYSASLTEKQKSLESSLRTNSQLIDEVMREFDAVARFNLVMKESEQMFATRPPEAFAKLISLRLFAHMMLAPDGLDAAPFDGAVSEIDALTRMRREEVDRYLERHGPRIEQAFHREEILASSITAIKSRIANLRWLSQMALILAVGFKVVFKGA